MDVLRLKGLEFYGRHGTETWEKQTGCRFTVDLELTADFSRAAATDRLSEALDYRVIFSRTRHVIENESHNLIEKVAARLTHEMFRTFPVARITVRVAKPEARIGGLNQAVEVEMSRTRAQWEAECATALSSQDVKSKA
jgi:dihydroneopterin aldolase